MMSTLIFVTLLRALVFAVSRVLIIEDDADTNELMVHLMNREGHQTDSATSVFQATQLLSHNVYDIVLTDGSLRDGDAWDVLGNIRSNGIAKPPIVILITGHSDLIVNKGKLPGIDAYFIKPIQIPTLLSTIRTLTRMNHAQLASAV